ncbi:MAG: complex I NDUFA9 subunit family protein [Mariprofundus sp.]|nr:complex I NDUFA9 subunit family protein [Mariprofundus sp.]
MGKQICIIGGSGFVGRAIAKQAITAGHLVTVACRHPERARDMLVEGVTLKQVDVADGRGIDEAVSGCDCVIYLVGLLFERGRNSFQAAHIDGVEHVIAACHRAGVAQYLHMSALGAGNIPDSHYATTKATAEISVTDSKLNWTIFRPSIIYGAGDSFFNKFKMMTLLPVIPLICGQTLFQPVWVEDVARAFVVAINNRHTAGQTYELAGTEQYSFEKLLQMMLDELAISRKLLAVSPTIAGLMAGFGSLLPTPALTMDQLTLLEHDNIATGEPFPSLFGAPAQLEHVLPTFIHGNQVETLQYQMDLSRQCYRKGSV